VEEKVTLSETGSLSPEFGVPVAKATIFAEDVIRRYDQDGLLVTGENELLTLIYRDSLESISADDFLSLEDQVLTETIEVSPVYQAILQLEGAVSFESTEIYTLDFGEDRLDSVRFQDGFFELSFTVPDGFEVNGNASLLDPTNGDVLLEIALGAEGGAETVSAQADLNDVLVKFVRDIPGGVYNAIQFDFFVEISSTGESIAPSEVAVDFSLTDLSIASVGGYISPRTIAIEEQSTTIDLFSHDFEGEVILEDPRLNLFIMNEYGIGVRPVLDNVGFYEENNEIASIRESDIDPFPVIEGVSFPGLESVSQIMIDNSTFVGGSNLTDYLQLRPDSVSGSFNLEINPQDNLSNFVTRDSELNLEFEVALPIYGSIANFVLTDTTDINLDDVIDAAEEVDEVEQLNLRLFVRNALPIDASVQLVFADENLIPVDSLFEQATLVIPAAPVDLSAPFGSPDHGRVIGESEARIDIEVPRERIDALADATRLLVFIYGNTTGNGGNPIRLYPENFIEVNLGAEALFNIDLTE
jgi:hypothetical protein